MDDDVAVKEAKTISAAEHLLAAAKHTGATVRQLAETPNDVMSLRRLEPDMFEAELRLATIWKSNAQLSNTLLPAACQVWQSGRRVTTCSVRAAQSLPEPTASTAVVPPLFAADWRRQSPPHRPH